MEDRSESARDEGGSARQPYTPPQVIETAIFETLALSCTSTPTDSECRFGGIVSGS